VRENGEVRQVTVARALNRPATLLVHFEDGAYLVGDVVRNRVRSIAATRQAWDFEWDEQWYIIRRSCHLNAGDQVDMKSSKLRSAYVSHDRDPRRHSILYHPAARGQRKTEVITQVNSHGLTQRTLSRLEVRVTPVEVHVHGVASQRSQSCKHGRRAFEHPALFIRAKHPAEQTVIRELTLKVGELGTWTVFRQLAQPIIQGLT
jgi:hypothetical protein